jgi:predicted SAM-dependent methyltransferase
MSPGQAHSAPRLLNLGCGVWRHAAWFNLDRVSHGPDVAARDLSLGIPFADERFDAVYHSHLLEHFPRDKAGGFLRECLRVLAPGGVLRVAVPDLEVLAKLYLTELHHAQRGDEAAQARYDWIMHELFDQMVRVSPGGGFARQVLASLPGGREFILSRTGAEAAGLLAGLDADPDLAERLRAEPVADETAMDALAIGAFYKSGEAHRWMYDRFSLGRLMGRAGFEDVAVVTAFDSAIPGFAGYHLDVLPGGVVRKPDSLFMEGRRPRA